MRPTAALIGTTAVVVGLLLNGVATAAGAPSRSEYVERLEEICKVPALKTERGTRGTRTDIQAGRLAAAAAKFGFATKVFSATLGSIAAVPRPSADASLLAKWFVYLRRQESYLEEITTQLRQRHRIQAQRLTSRFIHSGNLANNVVLAFELDYCTFKFSRYS